MRSRPIARSASLLGAVSLAAVVVVGAAASPAYAQTVEASEPDHRAVCQQRDEPAVWMFLLTEVASLEGPPPSSIQATLEGGGEVAIDLVSINHSDEAVYELPAEKGLILTGEATANVDSGFSGELFLRQVPCVPVNLTVTATPAVAVPGDDVTVAGSLTALDGTPLAGREIQLTWRSESPDAVGGPPQMMVFVDTDEQGEFQLVAADEDAIFGELTYRAHSTGRGPDLPFPVELPTPADAVILSVPGDAPTTADALTSSAGTTIQDETVLSGDGFAPGSSVTVLAYSTPQVLATTTADAAGSFALDLTVPSGLVGEHTLVAMGQDPGGQTRFLALTVTITGKTPDGGAGELPATGMSTGLFSLTGLLLLAVGGAIWAATRRRHVQQP